MIVTYRKGTFGWYIAIWLREKYNWSFGNYAWSGCWPSESMWIVPGTVNPDDYIVREYQP